MADQAEPAQKCTEPLHLPPHLRLLAGAFLLFLVSMVINDPRQPVPLAMSAIIVTFLIFGKAAFGGARWLIRESAVRFPGGVNPIPPRDLVAKLVPWVGFGAAIPASLLVSAAFLVGHRQPWMVGHVIGLVLLSFIPTLLVCLALLPMARSQAATSELFTDRDRGVFPLAMMVMLYAVGGFFFLYTPIHHGIIPLIKHVLAVGFRSLLPYTWPQHVLAMAASFAVLRLWFDLTGGALEFAGTPRAEGDNAAM